MPCALSSTLCVRPNGGALCKLVMLGAIAALAAYLWMVARELQRVDAKVDALVARVKALGAPAPAGAGAGASVGGGAAVLPSFFPALFVDGHAPTHGASVQITEEEDGDEDGDDEDGDDEDEVAEEEGEDGDDEEDEDDEAEEDDEDEDQADEEDDVEEVAGGDGEGAEDKPTAAAAAASTPEALLEQVGAIQQQQQQQPPALAQLKLMKLEELRALARAKGLDAQGSKAALLARLQKA